MKTTILLDGIGLLATALKSNLFWSAVAIRNRPTPTNATDVLN